MLARVEFQDIVRTRKMTRNYTSEPVDPAIVDLALRNAVRAPNAGFSQGWAFLVLDTPRDTERFWRAASNDVDKPDEWLTGMMRAPVVILPCSSKAAYLGRYSEADKGWTDQDEARWPMPFWHMDVAMASLLILQTATDHDLGSLFFGIPPEFEQQVRAEYSIPPEWDPVGASSIGHKTDGGAKGPPASRTRKPMEEVIHHGNW